MKTASQILVRKIAVSHLIELTTPVNETLDIPLRKARTKSFTAAQLWRITKNKKSIPQRKFI